jgi:hypothetical protein
MAGRHFKFKPGGGDPEEFFRALAPMQLVGTVSQVISMLSMPLWTRDPATVPSQVEEMLNGELRWLESAIGGATNYKAAADQIAGKLGEGLDLENIPATGEFTAGARINMRNAIFLCWTALPETRRTPAEAERIVRLAISRQFALMEDIRQELAAT